MAFYNEAQSRTEMHLVSDIAQKIEVVDEIFRFEAGERQHTENSYKYTIEGFQVLVGRAGFSSES
ncbi:hypothetical protein GY26_18185 [Gammaproteobacteria bacterium MFB021]|nr:hypothetical protein GY26_18185 [Gammaproteobacteria bacterium MFB021]